MTPELIRTPLLDAVPGLAHGFTTRRGGVSDGIFASLNLSHRVGDARERVERNRQQTLAALGRDGAYLVVLKQVHGAEIVEVTGRAGQAIQADGVWTSDRSVVLAVLVADCVPILIAASNGRAAAAVHAGWRGTRARIAGRMIERLHEAGFDPASLTVAMGPAIGPCCFTIGEDVEGELRQAFPAAHDAIRTDEKGRRVADLWELNRRSLLDAGVPADRIDVVRRCTACEPSEFYSHRRDAGQTGRQSGLISPAR